MREYKKLSKADIPIGLITVKNILNISKQL